MYLLESHACVKVKVMCASTSNHACRIKSYVWVKVLRVRYRRVYNNNNGIQRRSSKFFCYLLAAPRTVSNTYAQEAKAQSCENHVQNVASCRVQLGTKGQLSNKV